MKRAFPLFRKSCRIRFGRFIIQHAGVFFRFDRDGDLDMLLLNHNPNSLPVLDAITTAEELKTTDPVIGIKLYRNDNNHFTNVTAAVTHQQLKTYV